MHLLFDADVEGQDNQRFYQDQLEDWARRGRLNNRLGFAFDIMSCRVKHLKDEPLLLLADDLAGYFQLVEGGPNVQRPQGVTPDDVNSLRAAIEGGRIKVTCEHLDFQEVYPMRLVGEQLEAVA